MNIEDITVPEKCCEHCGWYDPEYFMCCMSEDFTAEDDTCCMWEAK